MCGWHRKRSDGRAPRACLLGALVILGGPLSWGGAAVRAADEDPRGDDTDGAPEGEEPDDSGQSSGPSTNGDTSVDATVEVVDSRIRSAAPRPESSFVRLVDDAVPPTDTVDDVLQDMPGASVRRTGGPLSPAFVNVRGSSAQQVAVFLDGVPLNAFGADAVDLSQLPLRAFDRVELYRGFAPPHLGGFAIGGAVDLVSDPARDPGPHLEVSYGSWHTRRVTLAGGRLAQVSDGVAQVRAHVAYTGTEGAYRTFSNNGTLYNDTDDAYVLRQNNRRDQVTGLLRVGLDTPRLQVRVIDAPTWSDGGVPGVYQSRTTSTRSRALQNLLHGRARIALAPGVRLSTGLGWRVRSERYTDLAGEVGVGTQDQQNQWHAIDGDVSAQLDPTPWLEVRPSVRTQVLLHRTVEHVGGRHEGPLHRRGAVQAAIDARVLPLGEALEVRGALGLLVVDDASGASAGSGADPGSASLIDVLPGVGVVGSPVRHLTLRASVARSVRAPTFVELFGDRGAVVGNPSLRPERGSQVDGAIIGTWGEPGGPVRGSVEVGGYVREVTDLIVLVPNSQRVAVPINLGRVLLAGVESHGRLDAGPVQGEVGLTVLPGSGILEGERGTVGNRVPHVPLWQVHASIALDLPFVRVGWRFTGLGGTFDSPSNFFENPARPLHDLHVRVQPAPRGPWVAVDLRNLLNTHVGTSPRNPLDPNPDDVVRVNLQDFRGQPLPGRSVMVTVGWSPGALP